MKVEGEKEVGVKVEGEKEVGMKVEGEKEVGVKVVSAIILMVFLMVQMVMLKPEEFKQ